MLYYDGTDLKADGQRVFSRLFSVQTALILYFTTVGEHFLRSVFVLHFIFEGKQLVRDI
jgi:hypothetical protein